MLLKVNEQIFVHLIVYRIILDHKVYFYVFDENKNHDRKVSLKFLIIEREQVNKRDVQRLNRLIIRPYRKHHFELQRPNYSHDVNIVTRRMTKVFRRKNKKSMKMISFTFRKASGMRCSINFLQCSSLSAVPKGEKFDQLKTREEKVMKTNRPMLISSRKEDNDRELHRLNEKQKKEKRLKKKSLFLIIETNVYKELTNCHRKLSFPNREKH